MLELHAADDLSVLARRLAEVLAVAPSDPMQADLVTVPSAGMRTWLSLRLARWLGAGPSDSGGLGDGVSANILFPFPGVLRGRVLDAGASDAVAVGAAGGTRDPWSVERLVWAILEVADLSRSPGTSAPGDLPRPLVESAPGSSRYAAARQVADLFDRYHLHRPAMVEAWRAGDDVDGAGGELPAHQRWQPALWRAVRTHLTAPPPTERLAEMLVHLSAGGRIADLPDRICAFGMSSLPGGSGFVDLAAALASHREVHLFVVEPSPVLMERIEAALVRPRGVVGATPRYRLRADVDAPSLVHHPLMRSWGRVHCETASVLVDAVDAGRFDRVSTVALRDDGEPTLLGRLRADIRADRVPVADLVPGEHSPLGPAGSRPSTIELHACHGPARQVEVLRDTILRLLHEHPHLQEDDFLVVCPALESFAPLIEATFGPSARTGGAVTGGSGQPPALRYLLADRSLGVSAPLVGAFASLVGLVAGRFDAPAVLDFLALAPVRARFGLDEEALGLITRWVIDVNIRFGLDPVSRSTQGIPSTITTNTWQAGIDRLLLGAAVRGGQGEQLLDTVGEVVPYGVEGSDLGTAGRLADVLHRLGELTRRIRGERILDEWLVMLSGAALELFEVPRDQAWQLDRLLKGLGEISESATRDGRCSRTPLTFDDVRRLVDERLHDPEQGRPSFYRGGITVSSLTPLRWVPHKVIVMLGMDAPALTSGGADGDDLTAIAPLVGDRDRRSELRQSLLETVLAAEEHLVVIRDGHDVRTNQEIPMAVPVAELRDAVLAMVHADHRGAVGEQMELHHPRQPFDEAYFSDLVVARGEPVPILPRSYDASAAGAADARRRRTSQRVAFLEEPLDAVAIDRVDLAELHRVLDNPIRFFLERRLELRLPREAVAPGSTIPAELAHLDRWVLGEQLLDLRAREATDPGAGEGRLEREAAILAGLTRAWRAVAVRTGAVPPGRLGADALDDVSAQVAAICRAAAEAGVLLGPIASTASVEATASDGTTVTGEIDHRLRGVADEQGPALVTCSRRRGAHVLGMWLDLAVLTLTDPLTSWRGVVATRKESGSSKTVEEVTSYQLADGGSAVVAQRVLDTVVDLHRRALREPLPLFKAVSATLWEKPGRPVDWPGRYPDAAELLVYGQLSSTELCELPLHPLDPPGAANDRARRFAEHLFGSLGATLEAVDR
jgi:exodeoxyribonuclease V gamma subunit